ncbi:MAG: hypothetical protein AAFZ15_23105 [Bacteroidota bacterium]
MIVEKDIAQSNISQLMSPPILNTGHNLISIEVDANNPAEPRFVTELIATDSTIGMIRETGVMPALNAQLMESPELLNNGTLNSLDIRIYNTSERYTINQGSFFLELHGVPDNTWQTGLASASDLSKITAKDLSITGFPDGISADVTKVSGPEYHDSRFHNLTVRQRKSLSEEDREKYETWAMLSQNRYSAWFKIALVNTKDVPAINIFADGTAHYFNIQISKIISNLISGRQGAQVRIHPYGLTGMDTLHNNAPVKYADKSKGHPIYSVIQMERSIMLEREKKICIGTDRSTNGSLLYVKGNTTFEANDIRPVRIKNTATGASGVAEIYFDCPNKKASKLGAAVGYGNKENRDFYIWVDGKDRLNVNKDGKISVGSNSADGNYSTPDAQLQVTADAGYNIALFKKSDNEVGLGINAKGNVGIGTAAVDYQQLYVKGHTTIETDTEEKSLLIKNTADKPGNAGVAEVYFESEYLVTGAATGFSNLANRDFYILVGGYDRFNISRNGKISIGTKYQTPFTEPTAQLEVKADQGNHTASFLANNGRGLSVDEKGDVEITGNLKMGNWVFKLDSVGSLQISNTSPNSHNAQGGQKLMIQYGSDAAQEVIRNNDPYTVMNLHSGAVDRYLWSKDTKTNGYDDCYFCNNDNGKFKEYANFTFSKYHY